MECQGKTSKAKHSKMERYWNLCCYDEAINNYEPEGICITPILIKERIDMHISNGIVTNLSNS